MPDTDLISWTRPDCRGGVFGKTCSWRIGTKPANASQHIAFFLHLLGLRVVSMEYVPVSTVDLPKDATFDGGWTVEAMDVGDEDFHLFRARTWEEVIEEAVMDGFRDRSSALLRRYGSHDDDCEITRFSPHVRANASCTCGLDAALLGHVDWHERVEP